jgi:hypothetical protein
MLKAFVFATAVVALATTAQALPIATLESPLVVEQVADGCGVYRYRGPGGACHRYGRGPFPAGYFGPAMWHPDRCPPGYWRGPWGHCRDTPFYGYLPGGGYRP